MSSSTTTIVNEKCTNRKWNWTRRVERAKQNDLTKNRPILFKWSAFCGVLMPLFRLETIFYYFRYFKRQQRGTKIAYKKTNINTKTKRINENNGYSSVREKWKTIRRQGKKCMTVMCFMIRFSSFYMTWFSLFSIFVWRYYFRCDVTRYGFCVCVFFRFFLKKE